MEENYQHRPVSSVCMCTHVNMNTHAQTPSTHMQKEKRKGILVLRRLPVNRRERCLIHCNAGGGHSPRPHQLCLLGKASQHRQKQILGHMCCWSVFCLHRGEESTAEKNKASLLVFPTFSYCHSNIPVTSLENFFEGVERF